MTKEKKRFERLNIKPLNEDFMRYFLSKKELTRMLTFE